MNLRILPLALILVAGTTTAPSAFAQEGTPVEPPVVSTSSPSLPESAPPSPPPAEYAKTTPDVAPYKHHGFYLNMELGFGGATIDTTSRGTGDGTATLGSGQLGGQLLLGGSLAPGLVLGGGTQGHVLTKEERSMGLAGPFVTFYPSPRGGLHFTGLVGLGSVSYGTRRDDDRRNELGVGASLGIGYDFWIGGDWSFGVTARASYVRTFENDRTREENDGLAGTLLVGFTYN